VAFGRFAVVLLLLGGFAGLLLLGGFAGLLLL